MRPLGSISADPQIIEVPDSSGLGVTEISWTAQHTDAVEVRVESPQGALLARGSASGRVRTGKWVRSGMGFYLQDVSDGKALSPENTLAQVQVVVRSEKRAAGRRISRGARLLLSRFSSKAVILTYHRVAEISLDPWSLCVTPSHFAEHLGVLKDFGAVIGLKQLVQAVKKRRVPRRAVALTFDDGYADNLHNAKPLLERSGIPAAVFVVSGTSRQRREFWWDELERLLLQPGRLPAELELSIDGTTFHWQLGAAADCDEQASRRWRAWRALGTDDPTPRHGLYRALHRQLQPLSEEQRSSILHQLLLWAGAEPAVRTSHRCLTDQEVAALAKGGLVEIGAHTVTHSLLPALPPSLQRSEIHESKQALENTIGRSVTLFSYPYGGFDSQTIDLVRQAGFSCACANSAGAVCSSSDVFQLPRLNVEDCDGEEFARRLSNCFEQPSAAFF